MSSLLLKRSPKLFSSRAVGALQRKKERSHVLRQTGFENMIVKIINGVQIIFRGAKTSSTLLSHKRTLDGLAAVSRRRDKKASGRKVQVLWA